MQHVIDAMNELQKKKIIKAWALGGGIAAKYYVNPPVTKDIDFFVLMDDRSIMFMKPIHDYFVARGGKYFKHMMHYKGIVVDIIATDDALIVEGIKRAVIGDVEGIEMKVLPADYLAAIALKVGRPKDLNRIKLMLDAGILSDKFYSLCSKFNIPMHKLALRLWSQHESTALVYQLKRGIKNLVIWFPLIWKDDQYDWTYLSKIMEFKLRLMSKSFLKYGYHVNSKKDAMDMLICAELLKRLDKDDPEDLGWKQHDARMDGWMKMLQKKIGKLRNWWS